MPTGQARLAESKMRSLNTFVISTLALIVVELIGALTPCQAADLRQCSVAEDMVIRYVTTMTKPDYQGISYFDSIGAIPWLGALVKDKRFRYVVVQKLREHNDVRVVPVMIQSIEDVLKEADNQWYVDDRIIEERQYVISTAMLTVGKLLGISNVQPSDVFKGIDREQGMIPGKPRALLDEFVSKASDKYSSLNVATDQCSVSEETQNTQCPIVLQLSRCSPADIIRTCEMDRNSHDLSALIEVYSSSRENHATSVAGENILRSFVARGAWKWALAGLEYSELNNYEFVNVIREQQSIPYLLKAIATTLDSYRYDKAEHYDPLLYALFTLLEKLESKDLLDEKNVFANVDSYYNNSLERESLAVLAFISGREAVRNLPECIEDLPFEGVTSLKQRYECGVQLKELAYSLLTARMKKSRSEYDEERILQAEIIRVIEETIGKDLIDEKKILADMDENGVLAMGAQLKIIDFKRVVSSFVNSIQDKNPQCKEYREEQKP